MSDTTTLSVFLGAVLILSLTPRPRHALRAGPHPARWAP